MANILDFGGVDDGVTPNDAALAAAMASMPGPSKCMTFPLKTKGVYVFANQVVVNYPAMAGAGLSIRGEGSRVTILHWPNAGGGLKLVQGDARQCIHMEGISVTTGQPPATAGTGIDLVGKAPLMSSIPWSDFYDVSISGDDIGAAGGFTHGWAIDARAHLWSCVNWTGLNTWGVNGAGKGIVVEGEMIAGAANYAVAHNFHMSVINSSDVGFTYGPYTQGVTMNQLGFGGALGSNAILSVAAPGSVLAGLGIVNTGFNWGGNQINLQDPVDQTYLGFNTIMTVNNAAVGAYMVGAREASLVGNGFYNFGPSAQAVSFGGPTPGAPSSGTAVANTFSNFAVNIGIGSGARVSAGWNSYENGIPFINASGGTSPNPGVPQP